MKFIMVFEAWFHLKEATGSVKNKWNLDTKVPFPDMYVTQPKLIIRMAHQKVNGLGKENRTKINAQFRKTNQQNVKLTKQT